VSAGAAWAFTPMPHAATTPMIAAIQIALRMVVSFFESLAAL
jgi:hypothetical protein